MFNLFQFFEKKPIVVVSCLRDIHLLSLQAQSINKHLNGSHDIYILVNERENIGEWNLKFDRYCRDWYANHNVNVIYKKEFNSSWSRNGNPKYRGWEDQQILKLAISERISHKTYLVLDSQNFLIKKWSTRDYPVRAEKIPSRTSKFSMSEKTYQEYCSALDINPTHLETSMMSISTPIFLKTSLIQSMIKDYNGLKNFSKIFFDFDCHPSEFLLYFLWAEKQGGFYNHHYDVKHKWNGPMVRESGDWTFDNLFDQIGKDKENWISVTQGAWKSAEPNTKLKLENLLKKYDLDVAKTGL